MDTTDWTFPTLAFLWEYRTGAIMAGGDRLDTLTGAHRERALAALTGRVRTMVDHLEDGWLVMTAFWMVEDLYKSFFRGFAWTPGVHDYLAATAAPVVQELTRRSLVLHYVIDATQGAANLTTMLAYLPGVFRAAGLAVVGPQLAALEILTRTEGGPPGDLTAIQRYRADGQVIADEVIGAWYRERRSTVYLNADFDDDQPGLPLDAALAVDGDPGVIMILRNQIPAEGTDAYFRPPPGVAMPAGTPGGPTG